MRPTETPNDYRRAYAVFKCATPSNSSCNMKYALSRYKINKQQLQRCAYKLSQIHTNNTKQRLLVQPYQLSGTIFQPQSLKQTVCLFNVVDTRHICLLLLLKTVVNCNVASASVSLHAFSFMALYKFVINLT